MGGTVASMTVLLLFLHIRTSGQRMVDIVITNVLNGLGENRICIVFSSWFGQVIERCSKGEEKKKDRIYLQRSL